MKIIKALVLVCALACIGIHIAGIEQVKNEDNTIIAQPQEPTNVSTPTPVDMNKVDIDNKVNIESPPTEPIVEEPIPAETIAPVETVPEETTEETAPVIEETEPVTEVQEDPLPEVPVDDVELPVVSDKNYPGDGIIMYTNNWVNVRSKPSLEGDIIGKLEEDTEVFCYETTYGWSKIQFDGNKIGYISNKYVDKERSEKFKLYEEVDELVYAGHDVNMRSKAEYGAPIIGKLLQGKSIRRIGIGNNGWSQCMYNNQLVFISNEYLSPDPDYVIPMERFLQNSNNQNENTSTDNTANTNQP